MGRLGERERAAPMVADRPSEGYFGGCHMDRRVVARVGPSGCNVVMFARCRTAAIVLTVQFACIIRAIFRPSSTSQLLSSGRHAGLVGPGCAQLAPGTLAGGSAGFGQAPHYGAEAEVTWQVGDEAPHA
jgi:hypothetical protein